MSVQVGAKKTDIPERFCSALFFPVKTSFQIKLPTEIH